MPVRVAIQDEAVEYGAIDFPEKALPLIEQSAPYKVLYGGRGGAKSWAIARALLGLGAKKKLFILCAREIQKSIEESVYKLLCEQIELMELEDEYDIRATEIIGKNGTRFVFEGLRSNISKIKSMEGIDICWVEEADKVSMASWIVLEPTIRRDAPFGPFGKGSELWVSFNPDLKKQYTYVHWVLDPPKGTVKIKMNWRDNPWFPQRLRDQKDDMKKKDHDLYLNIWEGHPKQVVTGAIYAKELLAALNSGRISADIKADMTKPVIFSFDLGKRDLCCWWAWQQVGMTHNAVDYFGATGEGIDFFLDEIEKRKYKVGAILLPHDARQGQQSAAFKRAKLNTIEKQVKSIYPGKVKVVANIRRSLGINAVRALFPRININELTCTDGIDGLQHYKYTVDDETKERSVEPHHDNASNPADAFRMYAVWLKEGVLKVEDEEETDRELESHFPKAGNQYGWMAN